MLRGSIYPCQAQSTISACKLFAEETPICASTWQKVTAAMKPLATATFRCALCNETAGTVELLPPGHPEGLSKDANTIFLTDFIGTEQVVVSTAVSPRVQAALDKADAAALYQIELL